MSSATPNGLTAALGQSKPFRPCDDCTCSPGLISRQGKRASVFLRQYENSRRRSTLYNVGAGSSTVGGTNESVYSSDSLCRDSYKEVNTTERLLNLRQMMAKYDLSVYIVPSEDEHQSEYVALRDERRSFISGFTGSAGIACITRDLLNFDLKHPDGKSILSTDGRYFNQALQELDFNWSLLRQGVDKLSWQNWCINEAIEMYKGLKKNDDDELIVKIGIDPKLISYQQVVSFNKLILNTLGMDTEGKPYIQLVPIDENLIDLIWEKSEPIPKYPLNDLLYLSKEFHGEDYDSKRSRLLTKLKEIYNTDVHETSYIVTALDEICWLLNLRGSDIEYNPVFFSYLLMNEKETILFTDDPYNDEIKKYFESNKISIKPYIEFWSNLKSTHYIIPDNSSWQLIRKVSPSYKQIHSPIDFFKSVKNEIEIHNAHRAQVKDSVCLTQYFAWLEDRLIKHESLIDEYVAGEKLREIRKTQKNYVGNSFETISSTGSNAAIIHYSPAKENSSMIDPTKIYLCDSGSQFLEGTTDITRTIHLTKPSEEEIKNYTLVLKGNLALERLRFPEGTSGYQIDCIARQFLWSYGLDYRHGTGHGIGSFLNVHEGPIGIGIKPHLIDYPIEEGNIISNEPGFYKDGEYGIRIENDVLVKRVKNTKFLTFENITMVPYCKKLIDIKLLDNEEKEQLNNYNKKVWENIVSSLQPQSIAYKWLKRETALI